MQSFDLFKDWTPEMLEELQHLGTGKGSPGKPRSKEHGRRISEAKLAASRVRLAGLAPVEWTPEMVEELKYFGAGSGLPGRSKSKEACRKNSKSNILTWSSYSLVEKNKRLKASFHSDESFLKIARANHERPSMPEILLDAYLQEYFPGEKVYTGDGKSMELVRDLGYLGHRVPDFVDIVGKKEVISVMGGLGFSHFLDDEEDEIEHYKSYGIRCIVVWEWDLWIPGELQRIFSRD